MTLPVTSLDDTRARVGFIGLGAMGGAVAARIAPHRDLLVFDRSPIAVARLTAQGARAASPEEIGTACDVVFISLPRTEDVWSVVRGPMGLAATLRAGAVVVDMTTGRPADDVELERTLATRDIGYADAPVSGGPQSAAAGTLAIFVGAAEATLARIRPVLDLISDRVLHVGQVGAGHTVKLVNNLMSACNRVATREAVAIAARSGVDLRACIDAVNQSSGRSYITEWTYPRFLLDDEPADQDFKLALMVKDVALALECAESTGVVTRMGRLTHEIMSMGVSELGADADINRLMALPS
ncbi:NAD(P)-dependent oxidoreductase [Streptomyces sp. NPDC005708]|uniref:NAD(P)-dependent oxidoreductase n=1 Tax=Streptomyces sp. NPDC005708 TaxID=3154564 RepID=UPI0033D14613